MKKFRIILKETWIEFRYSAPFTVEAETQEQAENIAHDMDDPNFYNSNTVDFLRETEEIEDFTGF